MNGIEIDETRPAARGGGRAVPRGVFLHGMFEEQAARTPDALALVDGELRWTYAELNRRAAALARHLAGLGVGPEVRVGLCLERSASLIAALLGVLKAGGAYVPLDPAYPRERLGHMLEDSRAEVLLTQERMLDILPPNPARTVLLDGFEPERDGEELDLDSGVQTANLAYVIYTSGSTGRPKGVAVEHRTIVAMIEAACVVLSPAELAGTLFASSVCFDLSVLEIFATFASGGALIIAENALALPSLPDPSLVTLVDAVPSAMAELVRQGGLPQSVRTVCLGAEPLRRNLADRVYATGHVDKLYNLYGPTEDSIYSTISLVLPDDPREPSIGAPIEREHVLLADPWYEARFPAAPSGDGEEPPAEILIGGAGVTRGYLGRPDLTAERFVPDPLATEPGARVYRTGDLGRTRATAPGAFPARGWELVYLGRIDFQVKIRGFRIELGEVEVALQSCPGVVDGVVMAREDTPGDKRLVAYVVPADPQAGLTPGGLRTVMAERLPEYMLPSAFVFLSVLPLNPNGKVDRKNLPAPDPSAEVREEKPDRKLTAPRTATEALLVGIWEKVLGLEIPGVRAGTDDDFFALGGHSLLATRAVSQVRDAFGVEIPLAMLFESPTPAALAVRLEALRREEGGPAAVRPPVRPVQRKGGEPAFPLSHSQERLWLIERLSPGTSAYNAPAVVELRGALNVDAWRRTMSEIFRRHEILRTVYRPTLDGAVQVVLPPMPATSPLPVPVIDLSGLPEDWARPEGLRLTDEDSRRPFDLEHGPVFRAALVRLPDQRWIAWLHAHHIATDGWSMGVLAAEIQALYPAFSTTGRPSLPDLPVQYADYAVWQRSWLEGEGAAEVEAQLAEWRRLLAPHGAPDAPLELPADRPRPAAFRYRGALVEFALPPDRVRPLRALARRAGGTLFMAFAAAFQALLARLTGREAVSIGTPLAGRTRSEIEPLIGFFLNTVVLRTDLGGDPTFATAVARAREMALAAQANQDVPFDRVVAEIAGPGARGGSSSPLIQVLLVLDTTPFEALGLPGLRAAELRPDRGAAIFDLTLSLAEREEGAVGWLEYSTDLFDPATAERITAAFTALSGGAAVAPETRLSDLPVLSPAERRQLLDDWSGARLPVPPRPETMHGWFERQADLTPDAVALVFRDEELTYAELDARANRVAHRLAALGIGPDDRVGLFVERSLDMMVAALGVLKAGAGYLALDPSYPRERTAVMAADAGIAALLTQGLLRTEAPAGSAPVLLVEEMTDGPSHRLESCANAAGIAGSANLVYLTYTSGSTGRPKGIAMTHGAIGNLIAWQLTASRMGTGDATLQFASLSFDVSFQEMLSTWSTGGTLVLIPADLRLEPAALLGLIERRRIARLFLPPVYLQQLAQAAVETGAAPRSLAEVAVAGEQLQITPAVQTFFQRLPGAVLANHYGPSETHVITALDLPQDPASWPALPAIGRPIAGTRSYLLDGNLHLVPTGVPGELYAGGGGLARGYLGRPDLTAERFVPDPFSADPGARLYRTGDLARFRGDGILEFLGRADSQVKIRGYRVEPLEVEAVLASRPGVAECAVVPRRSPAGRSQLGEVQLVAWVVPTEGTELTPKGLREDLLPVLPDSMVPARFVIVESLPQTPSGKLDRRALAGLDLPEEAMEAGRPEPDLPRTPTEELIAGLWARVLRRERVGRQDNFFELGGHSLLATQIASRVRDTFGVDVPARAVFEHPTPAALAERVDAARGASSSSVLPPVVPVGRDRPLPLSYMQERLWLLEQLQSRGVYHIPVVLRLQGPLDATAWLRSLAEMRRRHEALRAVFEVTLDGLVQKVTPDEEPWVQTVVDLTGLPAPRREAERSRLAVQVSVAPFDLAAGPLVRSVLVRIEQDDHAALLNFHHTVFDGWSVGLLLDELEALYPAFLAGKPSPLPELAVQYPDYAVWLREQNEGAGRARLASQLAYWQRKLARDVPSEVPPDRPRPAGQSFHGGDVAVEIPEEIGSALRALGREIGGTIFMALAAGFQILISRLSGQTEVSLGTAVAGRNRVETERLIGCFINELVLRTDLAGEPTFADALRRVREVTLEAYAHQDLPFERLLQELRPESSLSLAPLFQNLLVHVGTPPERLSLPGLRISDQHGELGISRLDLAFWLWERGDAVAGYIEYSSDLFDRTTVERVVRQLRGILAAGAAAPETRISDLPLLSDAERRQILENWSGAGETASYPDHLTLHGAVEAQAARTPEAVAARHRGEELTYAELERHANRLARHLASLGVGPEVRVGLYLERSLDLLAALLAVLKAGGAYLPLDPSHPRERLAGMLEDSRALVLITQSSLLEGSALSRAAGEGWGGGDPVLVDLDADREAISSLPDTPLGRTADPDNLAYLLYTSGSTGRPKGVQIPHRAVLNFLPAMRERIGFQPGGVTLALTTLSFDISVLEVFLPLVTGGRLELAGKEEGADPALLGQLVAESGVTLLQATPTTWRLLLQGGWAGDPRIQGLCGGEPLPPDLAALLLERLSSLWNVYGPTEATVWSAAGPVCPGEPVAIGPSLPNLRHYLLDAWLQPVPSGVPADLWIGGAGVGRGYWDRADLTAGAFLPDPFTGDAETGARMYRTGDRGRWLPDGRIELLGRADSQVKVRGFRIELGEIEAALAGHPEVREGMVLTRQDGSDTHLVAFLIPRQGAAAPIPVRELRDLLRQSLPDYMVPSAFVQLDRFPVNTSGKVDRKALLALEGEDSVAGEALSAAPRTFAEELLTGSWAEVLERESIGVHDNFFELGGHSLLAAQVTARIQAVFGISLPVRALFEAPTPAALAARIELALRQRSGVAAAAPIIPVPRDGDIPLSFSQEQLWILDQIQPGGVYNLPYALRLDGLLDVLAWRQAVAEVRRRHEALRTTFATRPDGGARQRIAPPDEPWPQPFMDLSGLPEGDAEAEAQRLTREEGGRPFDLAAGPLLRSSLVRLGPERHFALLTVHHIAVDGWSMGLLLGEAERLYEAFANGQPSPLPELPVQYADYAVWQREQMRGEALESQLAYWRRQLAGEPELELPADRPRPVTPTFRGDLLRFPLSAEARQAAVDVGRANGATLFMTLLAAFEALLHRLSGSADFTVGTPVANRTRTELEPLIGFFVNTLVIRADAAGDPTFAELLGRVRDTALGAYTHQDVPFEKLVEELRPERRLDRNPLFQVTFTFQAAGTSRPEHAVLRMTQLGTHSGMSKFDLGLFVGEDTDGSLMTLWEFSTELFDRATAHRFATAFGEILAGAAPAPQRRLGDLPLLTADEVAQLRAWNEEAEVALPWATLHEGFSAQAARDPHAVAVVSEEGALTYGELEDRANGLARRLVAEGVGPEVRVGLRAERSLELVVGVLGILKAGGAYVPLDPAYPQERLAFIAEDAGIDVVVAPDGAVERVAGGGAPALREVQPENAAYVIYTSGSTGKPKGVVVTHANALRLFAATDRWFGFGPGDAWSLFHSYAFDFSVWEIWGALLYGGRLVVVPYFVSRSPESFAELLRREKVTVLNQTPSAFDALSRVVLEGEPLPDLRTVIFGGEAISLRALEPWLDRFGTRPALVNMYGITETTVHVTYRPLTAADPRSGETPFGSPIGVPIPDLSVHLADRYVQLVPVGVPGEMLVGGAGLARGYLNRPDLTAERFVPDPFSGKAGARLYRSGDLARRHDDGGALEFLGRADAQVKIRGFRIEPGEIEAALGRLPGVAACAVLPRPTPEGGMALAAYVVPEPGAILSPLALREALLASLPEHMVPASFVEIPEIPLTPSGKVDRRALSRLAPARAAATPEDSRSAPRTPTEEVLAGLWLDLLGEERTGGKAGIHDDFFALGGHSLLAARLINRLRTAFGLDLPLRALFEAPTPARLAEKVDALLRAETGGLSARTAPPIVPVRRDRPLPLSYAQERLWFLDQMVPGGLYNIPLALRIEGPFDAAAWERSLGEIRRRHETLRTRFQATVQDPVQVIDPAGPWPVPAVDLSGLPAARHEEEALRLTGEEARRPFDLLAGPIARAALLRLGERDHLALLTIHHTAADGWSMDVLMEELERLYTAFAAGRLSPLPELPVQYADFAVWQRQWLTDELLAAQLAYWRQRLDGEIFLALPTDRPAPPTQTFRGATWHATVPPEIRDGLAALGRPSGSTLFMVVAAAWSALLHRYTGKVDITVGTPIAGRNRPEIEGLIGFFANVLVLRSDLSGDPPFQRLLDQTREVALGAYTHQDLPFEKLVEELRPERRLDQNPLFQVVLSLERTGVPPRWQEAGLGLRLVYPPAWSSKFDLHLSASDAGEGGGLFCDWEYKTDLFDEATVARFAGHWERLLAAAVANPETRLGDLPLLTPGETDQLRAWNPEAGVALPWASLHEGFAAQAARDPHAVAVVSEEGTLTYGELEERANRLAWRLVAEGVGPEVRVGLRAERSLELVVGVLGILKAGGAYVPLDPAYPQERLAFIAEDAGVEVVVTQGERVERVAPSPTLPRFAGEGAPALPRVQPGNAAYVIYTSGSTGKPKGVVVTHANAMRLFAATDAWFGFGPGDAWTLFHSYAFDFSVWEIWGALLYGGRLVLVPYFVSRSPEAFAELLRCERITVLNQTPSAFDQLARVVLEQGEPLADLRTVVFGGEAISLRALEPWLDRFGEKPLLVNMYGITETTVHVAYRPLSAADPRSGATPFGGPIGVPIPDLAVHLVDGHFQEVPVGVPAEMLVGGAGLARGYLGRPELTAERFMPDPFSGKPGSRLYRSGDLARRLTDGSLEFLGRADAQVKIRGFRIEPGEIEAALGRLPEVGAGVVLPRKGPEGDTVLAAYVAPRPGSALPPARRLREALLASLPEHMVPALFVEVEALPLTPSGKVDRRALASLEPAASHAEETAEAQDAPRTPTEELLAGIWLAALGVERTGGRVGLHDDFFEHGGHSLLATQVINRVRAAFGVDVPLRALFEAPTPAALAERIEAALLESVGAASARSAPPVVPAGRDRDLPLSFAQERLWFLDQMQLGNLYNVPLVLHLTGPLDAAAWQASLDEIRRRHESLRTRFRATGQGATQVVDPPAPWPAPVIDLAGLGETAREAEYRRLTLQESERAFDLEAGPLVRAALLRLATVETTEHVAVLAFHHIVADAWSLGVFLAELRQLYAAFAAGRPSPLSELPVQYADFAVWQREWLRGEVLDAQLAYWRERLAGDPLLVLPTDRPAPPVQTFRGTSWGEWLPAGFAHRLADLGRASGSTTFMVLLAGFTALLHRYTGNPDVAVGSAVANRNRPEIEGLIGFFLNTLVLRTDLGGEPTFAGLLGRVRETALGAYTHQDLPFEKLVEELRPERRLDQNPLFQVVLSFDRPAASLPYAGLGLRPVAVETRTAKFDLHLAVAEVAEEPAGLYCSWEYKTDLFDEATIVRLAGHWANLLADAAAHPDRPVSRLEMLSAAERHQLAREWNDTASDFPRHATLPERFTRQARLRPDAVALENAAGETLTYRGLADRAGRLAARLRGLGIGPEDRVAVALPRSFDLIAAFLGILEAGGAYVPLDPNYPVERLAFLLADSQARVMVTRPGVVDGVLAAGVPDLTVLEWQGEVEQGEVLRDAPPLFPENLAYVMYTSGSTGRPKGVTATHRNVVRLVEETNFMDLGPEETFLLFAPVSFDASTLEIWGALLHGGRLVVPPEGRASLAEIGETVRRGRVTSMWLTAGLFHQMVDEEIDGFAGIRQLLAGGDVISPEPSRAVLARFPGLRLIDGYGPTEGTTFAACHSMRGPDEVRAPVPIGRPVANGQAHILDARLEALPAGVPGELCIGGDGLARGYLDRPDLTAERFVPDPFSNVPGERLYRTGDVVRRLPDGLLEFLGRADLQVKVAGYRIEPTEIESVLDRHPAVGQSAVAVHDDPRAGRRLVAYVVPERSLSQPAELRAQLRDYLREKLPEQMVPALFILLDQLPLSPSGKVDRRALPEPTLETQEAGLAEVTETPRTPTEEILAGIWAEALGVERVGLHEDFFESGGHSLLATRVMSRVRQVFHADLSLRALFEDPTVAGLAAAIDRRRAEDTEATAPPPEIERLPRGEGIQVHPVALAQRRLWFLHQLDPAGFFLTITQTLRFRGELDAEALRRALEEIVARHEPLRTTFAAADGQPVQRIAPPSGLSLPWVDLSGLPAERREPEARRMAGHEGTAPFDLVRGPLMRPALVRLIADDQILLLSFHHLVFDGWSMDVLFRELSVLYEAFVAGRPSPAAALEPLPVQYADYAVWQRRVLSGPVLERQLAWWKEQLGGVPALELPLDHPRPAVQRFVGDWHGVVLPPEKVARLQEICRQQGVTLFMLLLAAVEVFLGRLANQREFPVGTPIASRGRPEVEDLIGFFINTLVLPADLTGEPTFRDLLARVREAALGAYAHQDLPFEMLVNELSPERQLSTNPIFNVLWNLLEASRPAELAGLQVEPLDFEIDAAHFDLMVTGIRELDGSLTLVLNDKRDLFDRPTAQRMMALLARLLDGAVADPDRPIWDLPTFDEALWHQVRLEWNDSVRHFPEPVTAERLFEAQVRRTPDALALAGPDEQLTYAETEILANRLAHRLQRLGVGPEVPVAIAFERSVELIVSALAIWKAGGCYLPLDLAAPPERLAGVIEDAGAPVVITRQRHAERFSASAAKVLSFEVERASVEEESAEPPQRWSFPANRAYIIYTSGSTGRPKGVEVQHDTLSNLIWWLVEWLEIQPGARSNLAALPAFDASIYEIWAYLAMGASVHAPPPEITPSARDMFRWIAAEKITHGHLTTPQADRALSLERPDGLGQLRWLIAGGDRLHQRSTLADSFDVVNIYGPTEATVGTTSAKVARQELAPPRLPSIGTPLANAEVYILDRRLRPVPFGSVGELYIGGGILSRGYLRRPDLEASRYLPNPLSAEPGARMYWTGDVVRYFPNGRIDFIGRSDHQVKIRGFRIELGEIESLLSAHPGIAEAVVVARQEPAGARLVAYVVPRNGMLQANDLKEYLRVKLPDYMVPSAFVALEALPLTSRDKVDRNALPAPTLPREAEGEAAAPLRSETEEKIARVWREVLQIDTFGGDDNFFDLGGHSLALVTIHERLQGEIGRGLSLVDLFENPTIRSLARSLDRAAETTSGTAPAAPEEEKSHVQMRADRQRAAQGWKERARQARPGLPPSGKKGS